ncbi:nuclear transport factor 2 family protein [Streptomyces sp. NPDC048448]|uniref:nuclear transport factor 2 family protein n=1 Tax=unclassified Streptomyces TaxID=2593676 RepID=UPI00143E6ED3|nr:nuclear transport factor 2 family protein [Streptomyces sp. RPA4-2]QIY61860.1 nuclear transport factor 2 family protein [Streptomyces sp. RPA4-2]
MSWKRGPLAALAVCALLGGPAGCGSGDGHGRGERVSASPVGRLLDGTDERGRHYREVGKENAPEVAIEVQPDFDHGWDVRLSVHHFHFSPAGARARAVTGRGVALLYLDGRAIATLRTAEHHLAGGLVPRGTHHVTARLYADDRTVWAVHGKPVQSTADITASVAGPTHGPAPTRTPTRTVTPTGAATATLPSTGTTATSGNGGTARTDTGGSPDTGGKAS